MKSAVQFACRGLMHEHLSGYSHISNFTGTTPLLISALKSRIGALCNAIQRAGPTCSRQLPYIEMPCLVARDGQRRRASRGRLSKHRQKATLVFSANSAQLSRDHQSTGTNLYRLCCTRRRYRTATSSKLSNGSEEASRTGGPPRARQPPHGEKE